MKRRDAAVHHMLADGHGLHVGGTQWHVLSAANVQVSVWDTHVVHTSIVLVTIGRASETATARVTGTYPKGIIQLQAVPEISHRTSLLERPAVGGLYGRRGW